MLIRMRDAGIALTVLTLISVPVGSASALDVTGLWMNDDGEGAVEIEPCGDKRCGRIVWLKEPLDENNPDLAARKRPLCGAQILVGLMRQDDGSWDGGSIYDPEEGKNYNVMMKPSGDNRLEVTGYMGLKLLGKTVTWTRGEAHLKRCQPETTSRAGQ